MSDLYVHKRQHRNMAIQAIERIRSKRRGGDADETDDAAQAITGALLAVADELGELREMLAEGTR